MTNLIKVETVEEMVEQLARERAQIMTGEMKREDALVLANHAGKFFKGVSLLLMNAEMRREVPDFPVLGNRAGKGSGPAAVAQLQPGAAVGAIEHGS